MLQYLADELPTHWSYLLVWPVILSMTGVYIYFKAIALQRFMEPPRWKWASVVLPGLGLLYGGYEAMRLLEPVYRSISFETGRSMTYAHYLAPLAPLFTIVAILVYERVTRADRAA